MHRIRLPQPCLFLAAALICITAARAEAKQIDLRGTQTARKVEQALSNAASGNENTARVRTLALDNRDWVVRLEAEVRSQRHSFFGKIRYSYLSDVSMSLDLRTGRTFDERLTVRSRSGSVDIAADSIGSIIENDLAQAIGLLREGGDVERQVRSDYDRVRDWYYSRHGRDNVYFASQSFVRWAGKGFAGDWVETALVASDDGPADLMRQAGVQAVREASDVATWLEQQGQPDAEAVARELLRGERVRWPNFIVKWQPVRYASRLSVGGRRVGDAFAVNPHAAFVLIWTGPGGSHSLVSTYRASGQLEDETPIRHPHPRRHRHRGRRSIELTRIACFRTQDKIGWDEAELRVWVDGRQQASHYRSMDNGYVWDLRLRLDFDESVRLELWDQDRRSGDDFLGEVQISADNLAGSQELREGIGHYRIEWSEVEL
jgi:hypothetical protein